MQDIDRYAEANAQLDERARRRQAAAEALNALTPEVIAEQKARQEAALVAQKLEPSPPLPVDEPAMEDLIEAIDSAEEGDDLSALLAEAVQPVVDSEEHVDDVLGIGQFVFQWILVNGDETNPDGYQLGLHVHIAGREPGGHVVDITQEMVDRWQRGSGLQGNRQEHRRFANALVNESVKVGVEILANELVYTLQALMQGMYGPPTETSVGDDDYFGQDENDVLYGDDGEPLTLEQVQALQTDDGPFADAPENADEVPEG